MTAGMIWSMVADALKWESTADLARLKNPTNIAYWDLCELAPFPLLRKKATLVFTGAAQAVDTTIIDVFAVVGTDGTPYREIKEEDIAATTGRPRWYYSSVAKGSTLSSSQFIQIIDAADAAASATVYAWYWVSPPKLENDSDEILLPTSRALVLKTVQYMHTLIDHDPEIGERLNAEFETAKAELLAKVSLPARFTGGER